MSGLRILIINPYPIDSDCPIGIMMSNLFRDLDSKDIMQLYTNECNITNSKFTSKKIFLTSSNIIKVRGFLKKLIGISKYELESSSSDRLISVNGSITSEWEAWGHLVVPVKIDKKVLTEITNFKPDVIYSQVYSYRMMKLLIKISDMINCPIVTHTLDDWFNVNHKRGIISFIPLMLLDRKMKTILQNGRTHLVASPKMKSHFEKNFNGEFSFVMNCTDYTSIERISINTTTKRYSNFEEFNPMKVIYAGGLSLERNIKLSEIGDIFDDLRKRNIFFELHIYTSKNHKEQFMNFMNQNIIFHESVKSSEIHKILQNANVLLHVESSSVNIINFTKYSLSTKIPEYLAHKIPIVYYGPLNIGVGEFLFEKNLAIYADSYDNLGMKLEDLYRKYDYQCSLAENNYKIAQQIFDCNLMRDELIRVLKG